MKPARDLPHPLVDFFLLFSVCGAALSASLPACSNTEGNIVVPNPDPVDAAAGSGGGSSGTAGRTGGGASGEAGGSASTGTSGAPGTGGEAGSGGTSSAGGASGTGGTSAGAAGTGGTSGTGGTGSAGADGGVTPPDAGSIPPPWPAGIPVPPSTQKPGNAAAGYDYLTNAGYFGCGMPTRFYAVAGAGASLPGTGSEPLPGRSVAVNGTPLAYTWNLAKNADGLDVVYQNCLQCHAGRFNGQLVVGLGNADADWTGNLAAAANAYPLLLALLPSPEELKEIDRFFGRLKVIGPAAVMRTIGTNPAEMLATMFISHRDKKTLAWSDTPFLTIPVVDRLPAGDTIVSKVPPWWRMSKKNGQFYNGMGRGDHRRSMMLAGSLCTDSVEQGNAIDAHFNDVNAYISTLPPPRYPFPIDRALADKGHAVFLETCATCHGTYAPDPVTYPNLMIPQATIASDDVVSLAGTTKDYGSELVDWYNDSWYGEIGHYAPYNAYMAPPLDAVWATAPYLHNGSVPDVATLLESAKRPKYWRRADHDTTHYDQNALGFPWQSLASGQKLPPFGVAAKDIYDTEQYSHSNRGHTFGDALTAQQRRAVIEYLKTL